MVSDRLSVFRSCKFVQTDASMDQLVQLRLLRVLHTIVQQDFSALSSEVISQALRLCLHILESLGGGRLHKCRKTSL